MIGYHSFPDAVSGITRTAQVLAKTPNRAVLPVMVAGLQSNNAEIRAATILAVIRRHERPAHEQLIEYFSFLNETDRLVVSKAHRAAPHYAAPALKSAILHGDATRCKNACQIISLSGDVDLFDVLVRAVEDRKHRYRGDVAITIVELAARVQYELSRWASGDHVISHDPSFMRHQLLSPLEQSLSRFSQHRRQEIIDAFLLIAPVDNVTLQRVLRDSNHPCHPAVVAELQATQNPAILERLVEMLRDIDAPPAVLKVISRRRDERFVNVLLQQLKRPVPIRVLHNLKNLSHIAWLEEHRSLLLEVDGRAQAVAVELALASGLSRSAVFDLFAYLLQNGLTEARRTCAQALKTFEGPQADSLVFELLNDPDAGVQSSAVRQLRARHVPDALERLVALLDSQLPEVRDAALSSLAEFNFTRYRMMFDLLDEQVAHSVGVLVHKVDHSAQKKLAEELSSPSITAKLRGVEMVLAMEAASDVQQQLIGLVDHENVTVRRAAVMALSNCRGHDVVAALRTASTDFNPSVAGAAQRGLLKLGEEQADYLNLNGMDDST